MAEFAPRAAEQAKRRAPASESSAVRAETLERRAAARPAAGYAALLNARAPGPQPVQRAAPPNRTGLPDGLKSGVEALSGVSLDSVRVHYDSPRPVQLNAHAYAQGNAIHLAPGQ